MALRRRDHKPKDVIRCTGCRRLVEKRNAKPGPLGGWYGPECYSKAVAASLDNPTTPVV